MEMIHVEVIDEVEMSNARRWFIYLVLFAVLLTVSNATVDILRSLFNLQREYYSDAQLAKNIAILLVGLPILLIFWILAQRNIRDDEEKQSFTRLLYLFSIIFIATDFLIHNTFNFVRYSLHVILGITPTVSYRYFLSPQQYLIYYAIPILVYSPMWLFHWRRYQKEKDAISRNPISSFFKQLYNYSTAGTGLVMSTLAMFSILRWILERVLYTQQYLMGNNLTISSEIARIIVGSSLWIVFWSLSQKNYYLQEKSEKESVIRKIYLYLILFGSIILVVASSALVLVDVFEGWLGIPSSENPTAKLVPISIFITIGVVWYYHSRILGKDASLEEEPVQQANVRRIFTYIMAGVGFAALLIGLGGVISVLIRYLYQGTMMQDLRKQLSWFSSLLIVGTPLWLIYWQRNQKKVEKPSIEGYHERRSFIRIYYLYFFTYLATVTIITCLVFIVSQLVQILMGLRVFAGLITDIGQSLSYSTISIGVVLYHRSILRNDASQINIAEEAKGELLNLILLDSGDGRIGKMLMEKLQSIDRLSITAIALTRSAAKAMGINLDVKTYKNEIANANGILGNISPMNKEILDDDRNRKILRSISASKASKLLIPVREEGYEWLGIDLLDERKIISEVRNYIRQLKTEGKIRIARRFTPFTILILIAVTLCFLVSLIAPLTYILDIW